MAETRIRVMIVDDHPVVHMGLSALIANQLDMELVAQAADGREAVDKFAAARPDVSLVDLSLPDTNGVQLIGELRKLSPRAHFIVLSFYGSEGDIGRAMRAGARAYLQKDASSAELLTAIRTVARGGRYLPAAVGQKLADAVLDSDLTPRELEVLEQVAYGLNNREIGSQLSVSEQTVKSHLKGILGKLGVDSRSKAVALALRKGLIRAEHD